MPGRDPRLTGNPELAHSHPAGATVHLLQPLAHERLGAIGIHRDGSFMIHGMWRVLYQETCEAFDAFDDVEQRLLEAQVGPDNMRTIDDSEFIDATYRSAVRAIVGSVLALQHLTAEIGILLRLELGGTDLRVRLQVVAVALGFGSHADIPGWDAVHELEQLRHAIEHPSVANLYSTDWAKVPHAWMFSDRPLKVRDDYATFFRTLADCWTAKLDSEQTATATFGEVTRGLQSGLQSKKPPRGPIPDS